MQFTVTISGASVEGAREEAVAIDMEHVLRAWGYPHAVVTAQVINTPKRVTINDMFGDWPTDAFDSTDKR